MEQAKHFMVGMFMALVFAASIAVGTIAGAAYTDHKVTQRIKAQCDIQGADYLEIGQEKLCVKAIK